MNISKFLLRNPFNFTAVISLVLIPFAAVNAYGPHHVPASRYIHAGDSVSLNQPIAVNGGAKIYVQNGIVLPSRELNWAHPYCYFHLYRDPAVVTTPADLIADDFEIISRITRYDFVSLDQPGPIFATFGVSRNESASEMTIVTKLKLRSAKQPEVIALNCGIWAVPNERSHLSLQEIKGALGEIVTLNLKATR